MKPQLLDHTNEGILDKIEYFCQNMFDDLSSEKLRSRLQDKPDVSVFGHYINSELVSLKIGYALDTARYYSWLGGVEPNFRRKGLARSLMTTQQQWCHKKKYTHIETRTYNKFRGMLILNLLNGFDIVETKSVNRGLKIILEKII